MSTPKRHAVEFDQAAFSHGNCAPISSSSSCLSNKWLALPDTLHRLVLNHLSVSDCIRVDLTCRQIQTAVRSATPATSTLCMDVDSYNYDKPGLAADSKSRHVVLSSGTTVLRFLPRHLRLTTENTVVTPRLIALARAVSAGVAADAVRGMQRLHVLETSRLCWCDLAKLLPLLPLVPVLRIHDAFVVFHDCPEYICRGLALTRGLQTLDFSTFATNNLICGLYDRSVPEPRLDTESQQLDTKSQQLDTKTQQHLCILGSSAVTTVAAVDDTHCTVNRLCFAEWYVKKLPDRIWSIFGQHLRTLSLLDINGGHYITFCQLLTCVPLERLEIRRGGPVATQALIATVGIVRPCISSSQLAGHADGDTANDNKHSISKVAAVTSSLVSLVLRVKRCSRETVAAVARFTVLQSLYLGGYALASEFTPLRALHRTLAHLDMSRIRLTTPVYDDGITLLPAAVLDTPHPNVMVPHVSLRPPETTGTPDTASFQTSAPACGLDTMILRDLPDLRVYIAPVTSVPTLVQEGENDIDSDSLLE